MRRLIGTCLWSVLVLFSMAAGVWAADSPTAFVGAHIIPIEGEEIQEGTLVISKGKIIALGPSAEVTVPAGAERVDLSGKTLMPGLVCTHSHIGGWGGGDGSKPMQPDTRMLDAINVRSAGFQHARAGGLTTLNIMPGSGHLSSGQTVYVKLRRANTIEDMLISLPGGRHAGGLKMANGTNSMRKKARFPGTRSKSAALVREHFVKAVEYREARERAGEDASKMPERDLALDTLIEVLKGERVVHHHTHRHDDIMTVLRLKEEFGFRVVLHHVSDGWKVADEIAAAQVPVSLILVDAPGGKLEAVDIAFRTGGVLERAGVSVAFHNDDPVLDSRFFLRSPALAVRAGMSRAGALRSVTLAGAEMLDLQESTGSLVPGKAADLVVLDGDPLSTYTKVMETWVEGVKVFDRSDPKDRLYAVGGYGASHDREFYMCCQDEEADHEE